ncbi:MAG: hypothetical protein L3K04_00680 [Thermoplasmata archaeon]|nr:hypothetical protein [Thermoplasmata archaeon]MCI4340869.1 hypothetical protein [Thermoplasmata archaeon]
MKERLQGLNLPPRFNLESVFSRLKELNDKDPHRELRQKIDIETVNIIESWTNSEGPRRSQELIDDGVRSFRIEVESFRRRFALLRVQRDRSFLWGFVCLVSGDLPTKLADSLAAAHFWETALFDAAEKAVLPQALDSVVESTSRRALDNERRAARKAILELGIFGDRVQDAYSRLVLTVDAWNSESIEDLHISKAWKQARLEGVELRPVEAKVTEATKGLQAALLSRFGRSRVSEATRDPDSLSLFGRALAEALANEAPA